MAGQGREELAYKSEEKEWNVEEKVLDLRKLVLKLVVVSQIDLSHEASGQYKEEKYEHVENHCETNADMQENSIVLNWTCCHMHVLYRVKVVVILFFRSMLVIQTNFLEDLLLLDSVEIVAN